MARWESYDTGGTCGCLVLLSILFIIYFFIQNIFDNVREYIITHPIIVLIVVLSLFIIIHIIGFSIERLNARKVNKIKEYCFHFHISVNQKILN